MSHPNSITWTAIATLLDPQLPYLTTAHHRRFPPNSLLDTENVYNRLEASIRYWSGVVTLTVRRSL
jgi:hypothetical protein